jgi:cell division protein ZapA
MPQITVTIDGKTYRMACDEGQEEHLSMLAERFDRYITHLRGAFGEIGDQRLTVMAGIMVVDELNEVQKRIKGLEAEIETLRKTRDEALSSADRHDADTATKLAMLADRMETIADRLGAGPQPNA